VPPFLLSRRREIDKVRRIANTDFHQMDDDMSSVQDALHCSARPFATFRTIRSPGIMFRDITTLLGNPQAFRRAIDELVHPYAGMKVDKIAGIEARGFILGGAMAHQMARPASFLSARRASCRMTSCALPIAWNMASMRWKCTAMRCKPGEKVILVDDLIATGGTAEGATKLLRRWAPKSSLPAS
jgi:adenine phosphoribosyltransferase